MYLSISIDVYEFISIVYIIYLWLMAYGINKTGIGKYIIKETVSIIN